MRRGLIAFGTLVLLWTLIGIVNAELAGWQVHLFVGGLFVVFAGTSLGFWPGFWTVLAAGAVCDVDSPLPFGTFALLFAAAQAVLTQLRERMPHDHLLGRVAIALLVNLGLYLVVCFARLHLAPDPGAYWLRALIDLLASQAAVIVIGPWFFALQTQSLAHARP